MLYVWPTVKAGAVYEGKYLLGTSFARPLIGKILVDIAKKEGADAIAHGATGKGNDQVRFELAIKALAPNMKIIAPWREWDLKSRTDCMEYAAKHDIPVVATKSHPYSMDQNVWHLSHEGGDLENPANAPKDDVYLVTHTPEQGNCILQRWRTCSSRWPRRYSITIVRKTQRNRCTLWRRRCRYR